MKTASLLRQRWLEPSLLKNSFSRILMDHSFAFIVFMASILLKPKLFETLCVFDEPKDLDLISLCSLLCFASWRFGFTVIVTFSGFNSQSPINQRGLQGLRYSRPVSSQIPRSFLIPLERAVFGLGFLMVLAAEPQDMFSVLATRSQENISQSCQQFPLSANDMCSVEKTNMHYTKYKYTSGCCTIKQIRSQT